MEHQRVNLSTEDFIELLIELDALQRMYVTWQDDVEANSPQIDILRDMITRKLSIRDCALAEYRVQYPELDQYEWSRPEFDA